MSFLGERTSTKVVAVRIGYRHMHEIVEVPELVRPYPSHTSSSGHKHRLSFSGINSQVLLLPCSLSVGNGFHFLPNQVASSLSLTRGRTRRCIENYHCPPSQLWESASLDNIRAVEGWARWRRGHSNTSVIEVIGGGMGLNMAACNSVLL